MKKAIKTDVVVVGAGFAGLSAAYNLAKNNVNVSVIEAEDKPGGLAVGFEKKNWDWTLEKHYHHWFVSDWHVRNLADEIRHKILFKRPKTSTLVDGEIYQLDSPQSLLKFPKLSVIDRLRTGAVLFYLKMTPFWKKLESITAKEFLIKFNGINAWKVLWKPLFVKKFGEYSGKIPASWFWARIKKRSASLGYPEGGFQIFADKLSNEIKTKGAKIFYNEKVESISKRNNKFIVITNKEVYESEKVICTLPTPLFVRLTKGLPKRYIRKISGLKGVGAVNLVLLLEKQFLAGGQYWLNVNEMEYPFLAVVEHTNFMKKTHYGGDNILYVGNYLPHEHKYFRMDETEVLKEFMPYLKKINPDFKAGDVKNAQLFKAYFAQPIIPLNYSHVLPDIKTPISGLYLANIQQVYPWDRGTNYAVELGTKAAEEVLSDL